MSDVVVDGAVSGVKSRVRVADEVVVQAWKNAENMTMSELADKLGMNEGTLRAQIARIKKRVMEAATGENKTISFPVLKDGRQKENDKGKSLLDLFS